jgi:hypothetical protein
VKTVAKSGLAALLGATADFFFASFVFAGVAAGMIAAV